MSLLKSSGLVRHAGRSSGNGNGKDNDICNHSRPPPGVVSALSLERVCLEDSAGN